MKHSLTILLFLFQLVVFGQTPDRQGLKEYSIPYEQDTIRFYIFNKDSIQKQRIFLYLQGTGEYPIVNADSNGECCMNNFPKMLMRSFPSKYAFVYINKVGLPYYVDNPNFKVGQKFIDNNNVYDRAKIANEVINYILKNVYSKVNTVAVLGHSEGTHVLAKLIDMNKKITHICYAGGSGYTHLYDEVLFIRSKMDKGEINAIEAEIQIQELYSAADSIIKYPNSTTKYFRGNTYKWWYEEINQPPINNLLKLKVPIFLIAGSNDTKVPISGSDYIKSEFERLKKTNLTYKVYPNSSHDFKETLSSGEIKNHWNDIFFDFIDFIKQNSR